MRAIKSLFSKKQSTKHPKDSKSKMKPRQGKCNNEIVLPHLQNPYNTPNYFIPQSGNYLNHGHTNCSAFSAENGFSTFHKSSSLPDGQTGGLHIILPNKVKINEQTNQKSEKVAHILQRHTETTEGRQSKLEYEQNYSKENRPKSFNNVHRQKRSREKLINHAIKNNEQCETDSIHSASILTLPLTVETNSCPKEFNSVHKINSSNNSKHDGEKVYFKTLNSQPRIDLQRLTEFQLSKHISNDHRCDQIEFSTDSEEESCLKIKNLKSTVAIVMKQPTNEKTFIPGDNHAINQDNSNENQNYNLLESDREGENSETNLITAITQGKGFICDQSNLTGKLTPERSNKELNVKSRIPIISLPNTTDSLKTFSMPQIVWPKTMSEIDNHFQNAFQHQRITENSCKEEKTNFSLALKENSTDLKYVPEKKSEITARHRLEKIPQNSSRRQKVWAEESIDPQVQVMSYKTNSAKSVTFQDHKSTINEQLSDMLTRKSFTSFQNNFLDVCNKTTGNACLNITLEQFNDLKNNLCVTLCSHTLVDDKQYEHKQGNRKAELLRNNTQVIQQPVSDSKIINRSNKYLIAPSKDTALCDSFPKLKINRDPLVPIVNGPNDDNERNQTTPKIHNTRINKLLPLTTRSARNNSAKKQVSWEDNLCKTRDDNLNTLVQQYFPHGVFSGYISQSIAPINIKKIKK